MCACVSLYVYACIPTYLHICVYLCELDYTSSDTISLKTFSYMWGVVLKITYRKLATFLIWAKDTVSIYFAKSQSWDISTQSLVSLFHAIGSVSGRCHKCPHCHPCYSHN